MRLAVCCVAALLATSASAASASFDVVVNGPSDYHVVVDGNVWLSSDSTHVVVDGNRFDSTSNLKPKGNGTVKGTDAGGAYTEHTQAWSAGQRNFTTSIRVYAAHAVFATFFPEEWPRTSAGDRDKVSQAFPTFRTDSSPNVSQNVGVLSYQGGQGAYTPKYCSWKDISSNVGTGAADSGPIVLFTEDLETSLVVSAYSNFMAHTTEVGGHKELIFGTGGAFESIPAGYTIETIVSRSSGINKAMEDWGDVLLRQYGKDRYAYKRDYLLNSLGYSTDNGAFYYYLTEPGKNYEDTLIDVHTYAQSEQLPFHYVLLDSWWYFKGPDNGVTEWDAMPDVFPHGLEYLHNQTGWFQQLHNRYWSPKAVYARQNGGDFDFLLEKDCALPLEDRFWDFLLGQKAKSGMRMYEQDWLDVEFKKLQAFSTNASLARTWLLQMGRGAERNGMTIQYCMSNARHVLQSVEVPAVTNVRASHDYHPNIDQWSTGVSGMFHHAVGLAPSKDNFWTTDKQKGTSYDKGTATEPYNRLQAAATISTTGPVATSDKIGRADRNLIMSMCTSDGMLLQPDKPATIMDAALLYRAFDGAAGGAHGELLSTYADVGGVRYSYVLAAEMSASYTLRPADLGYAQGDALMVFEANSTAAPKVFSEAQPLAVAKCGKWDFQFYTVAPALGNGWTLLGEPDKWISVSSRRFGSVDYNSLATTVTVRGTPGETVHVNFASPDGKVVKAACTVPRGNTATISVDATSASVQCN